MNKNTSDGLPGGDSPVDLRRVSPEFEGIEISPDDESKSDERETINIDEWERLDFPDMHYTLWRKIEEQ